MNSIISTAIIIYKTECNTLYNFPIDYQDINGNTLIMYMHNHKIIFESLLKCRPNLHYI